MADPTRTSLIAELAVHGLTLRGGWIPNDSDRLPQLPDGSAAAVVWMVGVVGSAFWPHFKASAFYQDGLSDPLDRWSAHLGHALAAKHGGRAVFPFDGPPFYPFQQWADRSEPTESSPIMLRIHPRHGLWHAYRFALTLPSLDPADAQALQAEASERQHLSAHSTSLCAQCNGQPCLQACPVDAFTAGQYRIDACATHLHAHLDSDCMQHGCLARRACPVGADARYTPEHAVFHMQAFVKNH
jgi:hypothetical protein